MKDSESLGLLQLPEAEEMEKGTAAFDIHTPAMQAVVDMGFVIPGAPADGFRGDVSKLTDLDDNQLGDLLQKLDKYCEWVESEYAIIESVVSQCQEQLDFVRARVRITIKATQRGRLTEGDKKDMVDTNIKVIEAKRSLLYYETMLTIIKSIKNGSQRKWDTVSRRITQRGQEIERMKRETNIAGVPMVSRSFRRPSQ